MNIKLIKTQALAVGADLVGVAPVERFASEPPERNPLSVFPECKSVISVVALFPRGTYRGITEGTYWPNYTYYSKMGITGQNWQYFD